MFRHLRADSAGNGRPHGRVDHDQHSRQDRVGLFERREAVWVGRVVVAELKYFLASKILVVDAIIVYERWRSPARDIARVVRCF